MSRKKLAIDYVEPKTNVKIHLPLEVFKKPDGEEEYMQLEKILDQLTDIVRGNDRHPLVVAMQIIGDNLEQYDDEHYEPIGYDLTDVEIVKYLMSEHDLNQVDLADIFGSQGNVSKFLKGERELSKAQILGLKERFGVSADFFLR